MKYEAGKEYPTRGGGKSRIYATDGDGEFPIHGAVQTGDKWDMITWTAGGCFHADGTVSKNDLMPIPREWWIVGGSEAWEDEQLARRDVCGTEVVHVREVLDND